MSTFDLTIKRRAGDVVTDDPKAELHRTLERIVAEEAQRAREQANARAEALGQTRRPRQGPWSITQAAGSGRGRQARRS